MKARLMMRDSEGMVVARLGEKQVSNTDMYPRQHIFFDYGEYTIQLTLDTQNEHSERT